MAKVKKCRDGGKFATWFDHILSRPLTLPQNDRPLAQEAKLAEYMEKGQDYDAYLRRVRRGEASPNAETAYRIGVALRACGVEWVSGPLAVHAAGHVAKFFGLLAICAGNKGNVVSEYGVRTATVLAYLALTANEVPGYRLELAALRRSTAIDSVDEEIQRIIKARDYLAKLKPQAENLWDSWTKNKTLQECVPAFRQAHSIVADTPRWGSTAAAERGAIVIIDHWLRVDVHHPERREIAKKLRLLSPIWMPEDTLLPLPISKLADAAKKGSLS